MMGIAPTKILLTNIFVGAIYISPTHTHMEKIPKVTDINEYKRERLEKLFQSVTYQTEVFLQLNGINNADIIWTETNDLQEISFTVEDPDSQSCLLTGERLHQDLIVYLMEQDIPELKGYIRNPYVEPGFISFIKE